MGTRSRIGIELKDRSIASVYCHYDGYPEHNGKILKNLYTTREQVANLIDGGSMSSLRTRGTWEPTKTLRDENGEYITDEEGFIMSENDRNPQPLYHSERGEEINVDHTDLKQFLSGDMCEEYAYLFTRDNQWKCYKIGWGETNTVEVEIP